MSRPQNFLVICSVITLIFLVFFIVMAIILPGIIHNTVYNDAAAQVLMKKSNYNQWGEIPGQLNATLIRNYYFFNFTNPFETVFSGAQPVFVQTQPYCYQEYQNFSDPTYLTNSADEEYIVNYNFQNWNMPCSGSNYTDEITTINVGALGLWYVLKTAPQPLVAINGLSILILGLEQSLYTSAIGQATLTLNTPALLINDVLAPSGINDSFTQQFILNDPNYGLFNNGTIFVWVQAWLELKESNVSSTAYALADYFKITYNQIYSMIITELDSEQGFQFGQLLLTGYLCPSYGVSDEECDAETLTVIFKSKSKSHIF